jgi:superoxide dismutase, Cu-Zn family
MKAICAAVAVITLTACASTPSGPRAVAQLEPTKNSRTSGQVTFEQAGDQVHVVASIQGLKPGQQHGFHIHEAGDCSSGDGMSTKGHFNPMGKPHAHPGSGHAGDLPALQADASGNATVDVMATGITVSPGPTSVVGRGLIVHADPDDYKTQPTGNAGARIACAVIRLQ